MTTGGERGFLHRWSRRKSEAREGVLDDEGDALQNEDAAPQMPVSDLSAQPAAAALPEATPATQAIPEDAEAPPLTLQDVQALTRDSDFAPFVSQQVAPEVKNAALKKLFADPHYNVMDGLDTYIDDYSNMESLPAPTLRRMVSAQALKMFESGVVGSEERSVDALVADGAEAASAAGAPEKEADGEEVAAQPAVRVLPETQTVSTPIAASASASGSGCADSIDADATPTPRPTRAP